MEFLARYGPSVASSAFQGSGKSCHQSLAELIHRPDFQYQPGNYPKPLFFTFAFCLLPSGTNINNRTN
ncbi:MAG: hypothetical protein ACNA78_11540, partial [Balneolaceae bacterium]